MDQGFGYGWLKRVCLRKDCNAPPTRHSIRGHHNDNDDEDEQEADEDMSPGMALRRQILMALEELDMSDGDEEDDPLLDDHHRAVEHENADESRIATPSITEANGISLSASNAYSGLHCCGGVPSLQLLTMDYVAKHMYNRDDIIAMVQGLPTALKAAVLLFFGRHKHIGPIKRVFLVADSLHELLAESSDGSVIPVL
jgi:hypothetical protein